MRMLRSLATPVFAVLIWSARPGLSGVHMPTAVRRWKDAVAMSDKQKEASVIATALKAPPATEKIDPPITAPVLEGDRRHVSKTLLSTVRRGFLFRYTEVVKTTAYSSRGVRTERLCICADERDADEIIEALQTALPGIYTVDPEFHAVAIKDEQK
jgi:hypothetical protein